MPLISIFNILFFILLVIPTYYFINKVYGIIQLLTKRLQDEIDWMKYQEEQQEEKYEIDKKERDDFKIEIKSDLTKKTQDIENLKKAQSEIYLKLDQAIVKPKKNDIDEEEEEEIEMNEDLRIPIVDGMKIKFEGENKSYPLKIDSYGQKKQSGKNKS